MQPSTPSPKDKGKRSAAPKTAPKADTPMDKFNQALRKIISVPKQGIKRK